MSPVTIREAVAADVPRLAEFRHQLWTHIPLAAHQEKLADYLEGRGHGVLPVRLFVAELEGKIAGFLETSLRSFADGCDRCHPVGYLEAWYVLPEFRRTGTGGALVAAAEEWARSQGCREMASDTWIEKEPAQRAHEALGYQVVDRCVHYRKLL